MQFPRSGRAEKKRGTARLVANIWDLKPRAHEAFSVYSYENPWKLLRRVSCPLWALDESTEMPCMKKKNRDFVFLVMPPLKDTGRYVSERFDCNLLAFKEPATALPIDAATLVLRPMSATGVTLDRVLSSR